MRGVEGGRVAGQSDVAVASVTSVADHESLFSCDEVVSTN